ncbi:MAG: hypothetical protein WC025_04300 [Candidatus Magasanikbacteria bacterium]
MFVQKNKLVEKKQENIFFVLFFALLTLVGFFGTYYFFGKYNALKKDPALVSQKETDNTLDAVDKLMILPSDEVPTVATILDKTKLSDQSFFDNAENGDKLLVFTKNMQAILYRPPTNKIIKVAPIYIKNDSIVSTDQQVSTVAPPEISQPKIEEVVTIPPKIAYYNGTFVTGLSSQTESIVKNKYPDFATASITNASIRNYKENIIVDISGQYASEVSNLSSLLNAKIMSLPKNEIKPNADILIISGK